MNGRQLVVHKATVIYSARLRQFGNSVMADGRALLGQLRSVLNVTMLTLKTQC